MSLPAACAALMLTVVFGLGAVAQAAQKPTFTLLYSFRRRPGGLNPIGNLARDMAGNLYGTTTFGGLYSFGCGTVFKVSKTGKETVLYRFAGGTMDGCFPDAGLIRDAAGNLYGTTDSGGTQSQSCDRGCGTVFKLTPGAGGTWTETVLYEFTGGATDGTLPYGGLVRDAAGNLYGTTQYGGPSNYGTIFKVSKTGQETVLHFFIGSDGANPFLTSLLMDTKDNLYGVAYSGGASGDGTLYELDKNGTFTVLHDFAGGTTDGCRPLGTLAMDKNGDLYGATQDCGSSSMGIVWEVSKIGTETVLHNFAGGADGTFPYAGVILDAKGNLYGDTYGGGSAACDGHGCGTVYKLSSRGTLTVLHSFARWQGRGPTCGLIRDAKGNFYGTANVGGISARGTVWKLTP